MSDIFYHFEVILIIYGFFKRNGYKMLTVSSFIQLDSFQPGEKVIYVAQVNFYFPAVAQMGNTVVAFLSLWDHLDGSHIICSNVVGH